MSGSSEVKRSRPGAARPRTAGGTLWSSLAAGSGGGPCPPWCSEPGAGQCRRAERGSGGWAAGLPCREGPAQGAAPAAAPGTSAERRPGAAPAPGPLPPRSRNGLFGREGGRGLPFLREVLSLARETFYFPVHERQLVALTEVRGVFGFPRTSLLLHLPPPPRIPPPVLLLVTLYLCVEKGVGGRLVGGMFWFCQRNSAKREPRLGEGTRINK